MAKKSKIESALVGKLGFMRSERDKLDAIIVELESLLRDFQSAKATPKRNRASSVRQVVVNTFNETAKAATKPTV